MENIKFLDLIKKSYDIINGDRKRFGILFGIGTILSFLVVKDRINPISTTVLLKKSMKTMNIWMIIIC